MKQFKKTMSAMAILASGFFMIGSAASAPHNTLAYVGSSTVGKFMHEAAVEYKKIAFKINTKPESGGGENATAAGKTDLGGVAREVKPKILARDVNKFLIGRDAIAVLVNSNNPVDELSSAQLKGIFTGKITNWGEVGGNDLAINVYVTNAQSATRKVFGKIILGDAKYAGSRLNTVRPDPAIADKIVSDDGGIGQLSFALLSDSSALKRIKPDGHQASVNNPSYPITRPLYLITKGEPEGDIKDFIEWSQSDAGQAVVKRHFVGL